MAQHFSRITRFPAELNDGSKPIVPGNAQRRVISFHNCDGLGSLQISLDTIQGLQFAPFQVVTDPFYLRLDYHDWGDIVCRPWFISTSGIGMDVLIMEIILL